MPTRAFSGSNTVTWRRHRSDFTVGSVLESLKIATVAGFQGERAAGAGSRQRHTQIELDQFECALGNQIAVECLINRKLTLVAITEDYQDLLEARGIVCSMSRRGNCWDNAVMESFFSTVKSELGEHFDSHGDAKMELFDYIEVFYPGFPFCRPLMAPLYTRDPPSPRDCFRRTIVQVLRPSLSPR